MWFEDYQLSYQFVRLLLKVEICSVQLFADLTFRTLVDEHLITVKVFHGFFPLGKTSGPTAMAAGNEVLH